MIPRALYPERRIGVLLAGALVLLLLGIVGALVLPAQDPLVAQTSESERAYGDLEREGMQIYAAEGCWTCHTQQVRRVRTDSGVGAPLLAGDYAADQPAMLGLVRLGPDLTHVGERHDADGLMALLRDPRRTQVADQDEDGDDEQVRRRHSSMPSYAYLTDEELRALTAYLLSLR